MIITGNPKYDFLHELPLPEKNSIMVNCNFTYGIYVEAREKWLDNIVDVTNEMRINLISKHPRDTGGFKEGIEEVNSNAYKVMEQLSRCSIVITRFSTIIYEAILAGRQVIYYNPHNENFGLLSNDETGTIIYAKNKQELRFAIIEAINRNANNLYLDERNAFLLQHIGYLDHTATKKCQNEIIKIVEENKISYNQLHNLYVNSFRTKFENEKVFDNNIFDRLWVKIRNFRKIH